MLYLFAVLGTSIFGMVKQGPYLHDRANFENFPSSFLTLFRVSTGDTWNGLYHDLAIQPPNCDPNKYAHTSGGDCGSPIYAKAFFMAFQVGMGLIMMNVLVSVFLENFDDIEEQSKYIINFDEIDTFQTVWTGMAPGNGMMLPIKMLPEFLRTLPRPLGLRPEERSEAEQDAGPGPEEEEERLWTIWDTVDGDGSGALDRAEVGKVFEAMGQNLNEKKLAKAFKAMDSDGGGEISFEELLAWWRKQKGKAKAAFDGISQSNPLFGAALAQGPGPLRAEWALAGTQCGCFTRCNTTRG